ncbi:hypothetical protein NST63_27695 [Heyndrickxia sp. FSL W8-0496]|uniref:hypothetical protein n=1 Tax=Heyndrickxia sp. FSL W8-0496 TaxID=2954702 RepID=UPI0030FCDC11
MKIKLLNLPFVLSSVEAIDFKTFCAGGSPEYVKAKQHLENLREKGASKIGSSLKFKDGTKSCHRDNAKLRSLKAYSLYINPLALFDVRFALIGAIVILVAILEKGIAQAGMVNLAATLSSILRIAFPVVAIGSMIYLISQVGVFL